ncbi:MAG: TrkH family potassium uptake protein [Prevotellaceae bacterium]|nr:TrkH family potassium uptake protein [Prevotellaceae bacterium]
MKKVLFGILLMMESIFLAAVLLCSVFYHYRCGDTDWQAFAITTAATFLSGLVLWLYGRKRDRSKILTKGDCFIVVALTWAIFSAFGMLPFLLYKGLQIGVTDAYFETMSGFTTTGATVLSDIDSLPHGLLLWRSLTQWMGGLGIVVFSFALLPVAGMKNANIYQAEATGISLDRLRPKIGATARRLLLIYIFLTSLCALLYWLGPMDVFDALNHGMSTMATGGYSTHSQSLGYYHSAYIEYVATVFMLLASVNFSLYYYLTIRKLGVFFRNEELQTFLYIVAFSVLLFCFFFLLRPRSVGEVEWLFPRRVGEVIRTSLFHVATIISTTGFQGECFDYVGWGATYWIPTVLLMIVGSCAGSTAGGMKVVRIVIYFKAVLNEFLLHLHPHAVLSVRVGGRVVSEERVRRVMAFIVLYLALVGFGVFVFTLLGIDVDSALGACVSALSNIGPGTGVYGPASSFAQAPAVGKWLLSFYMLVGRLEIFTVLFLFMPRAWRH